MQGNEEWITDLENNGDLTQKEAWRPWYTENNDRAPSGYVTTYSATAAHDFSFVTIRLAGHMVPTFQPASSFSFFKRFLAREPFAPGGPDRAQDEL